LIRFRTNNLWQSNIDNGKKNPTFIDDFLDGIRFRMVQLVILLVLKGNQQAGPPLLRAVPAVQAW